MPYFSTYVDNDDKSLLFYDLWARTTLEYSTSCDEEIDGAIETLDNISEVDDMTSLN